MAKFGKLTKLRSALKKINSLGNKLTRSDSATSSSSDGGVSSIGSSGLQTVYVGRSQREYRVDPDLLGHPVMQELVERSDGSDRITVGCEVVLFDHLRWIIHNSDDDTARTCLVDDDLAAFYAY